MRSNPPTRCRPSFLVVLVWLALPAAAAELGWYRFPALHGETLVFVSEGDLWTVPASGGTARRLTSHPGLESHPAISPDGQWLAFTGQLDGPEEVYVMPLAGGVPRRLSFEGGRALVRGWTPQGEVLYSSAQPWGAPWSRVLRAVHPQTLAQRELPLADANQGAFDGARLWFTRFGLELTGDHARGYVGGAAAQLWSWDGEGEAQRVLPELRASLHFPMPGASGLVVVSDRDGSDNLWRLDPASGQMQPLTTHTDFEVRQPYRHGERIVYQHGADLRIKDLGSGEDRIVPIRLAGDFEQRRERWIERPMEFLNAWRLAADGERVALTARGRAVLAGPGALRRVELAADPAHRLREATPSVDGRHVFAIFDASGENEIWRFPADGSAGAEPLTREGDAHRWRLSPSPDGRWLAHSDSRGRLWLTDLRDGSSRVIDRSPAGIDDAQADLAWSADGRYLAFARAGLRREVSQIWLYDTRDGRSQVLTSDRFPSYAPAFSPDGRWLYFLSDRNYRATPSNPWGDRNMGPMFDRRTQIFALALQPGLRFPFAPPDELAPAQDTPPADPPTAGASRGGRRQQAQPPSGEAETLPAVVWEGLSERLFEVPLPAGNYSQLAVDAQRLYFIESDIAPDARPALRTLAIGNEGARPETFAENVRSFELAAKVERIAWLTGDNTLFITERGARAPSDTARFQVRTGDWRLRIDPVAEWRQMYFDAWRLYRDFLFDRNLRGLDWVALRERYAALLPRIGDRHELDELLAQLNAELGVLHSQVRGGDYRTDRSAQAASFLGARFEAEPGGLRVLAILRGEPDLPGQASPLARPGVDVRAGDLIVAVNGRPVRREADLAQILTGQAGQQVLLELRRGAETLRAIVLPVAAAEETRLRYTDWVEGNRRRVEQAGSGRIGYLHLRAMGPADIAGFVRDFHAQFERDGLIIDVRRNGGGNIDSWIIGTLLRRAWAFWQTEGGTPYWNPQQAFRGHLAVLIDPLTYSDGETFAAGVKALGLGPLIGQRTAGAGVWLTGRHTLADRGVARVPEFPQFAIDGRWIIEGLGVAPDIEVENPPRATHAGEDAQLEAAITHVLARLAREPIPPLEAGPLAPRGVPAEDVR